MEYRSRSPLPRRPRRFLRWAFLDDDVDILVRASCGDYMRHLVSSYEDEIEATARDFIRHPVSKRLKRMSLGGVMFERLQTQKMRYKAVMNIMYPLCQTWRSCQELLYELGVSIEKGSMDVEKVLRKAELFRLIMGFKGNPEEISFEEFCWRRDMLAKLMKQNGNSPAAAGGHSNTVRSRRGQFSGAPHCHCNNVGHHPVGSDYYNVVRNNNMMNLGGAPGGNDQVEVGRPNYGTDNSGGNDQMVGIQPYQGYGGGNNTNNVTGNNTNNVGHQPGGSNMMNCVGGPEGNDQVEVWRPNYGTNNSSGNDQMVGIQPYQGYGGGNNTNNVGHQPGGSDMMNCVGGPGGNDQVEVGRPNYGTNNSSGNDQIVGIQPYQGYGGGNNANNVTGNNTNNVGHQPGGSDYYSLARNNNMMNWGGGPGGNEQVEVGRPNYGTNNSGGNDQMVGIQPYQGYGGGNNTNNVTGYGMGIGQFPSNGNNIRCGSGVDASGNSGGSHGGNGVVTAQFPSTGNNTGGSCVFGSDLRLPSPLFRGSINDWNDAELSDEEQWLDFLEIDDLVN